MRRARMILNPVPWSHRAWKLLPLITETLEDAGVRVDLSFTRLTESLPAMVSEAVQHGYDMIIAGGGDGTVSEVAAGLVGIGMPLGILPFGTYNNIAHSLDLPLDLKAATRLIAQGRTKQIDVGSVNGVPFFEAVGVGLDATLFPIGEDIKGGHYEKVLQGAIRFLRYRQADFTITLDKRQISLRSSLVVVANGPYYGAGIKIAPHASLSDGKLDVITFDCNKVELARHFALSARRREHEEYCVYMERSSQVIVESPLPLPAHADGKPMAGVPVNCTVLPGALSVIVGEE